MLAIISSVLEGLGNLAASVGTNACSFWFADEPECPKSLIK